MEEKLLKIISFGQSKLSELKTLKESNIEQFKEILYLQINYINDIKQKDLANETEYVLNLLDMFFERDFNERKKDLNEIKNLYNEIEKISQEIENSVKENDILIEEIKTHYHNKIKESLISNKEELKKQLESKKYDYILEEINKGISKNLNGLNKPIIEYLLFNEKQEEKLLRIERKIILNFSLKRKVKPINFSLYMARTLGNEDLNFEKQIFDELKNSCEGSSTILFKKGIKEFFNSLFSNLSYLENIIDILIDTSLKKINSIFDLIKEGSIYCLRRKLDGIRLLARAATLEFNDEQRKKWKELCVSYKSTRQKLIHIKNYILNISNN